MRLGTLCLSQRLSQRLLQRLSQPARRSIWALAMTDAVLSILVLAAIALLVGAWFVWRKTGDMRQAGLMAVLAIVALLNVAIWTVPDGEGEAPLDRLEETEQSP